MFIASFRFWDTSIITTHPRGEDFHPTGGEDIPSIPLLFNATEGRGGLSFGYLLTKFSKVVTVRPL